VELLKAELAGDSAQTTDSEVQVARTELAITQAKLKRMSELVDQKAATQFQLEQAEAEVASAQARLNLAVAQYPRLNPAGLAPNPAPSAPMTLAIDIPDALKPDPSDKVAHAELDVAESGLNIARARLKRTADLVNKKLAAQSELEVAEAELSKAEAQVRLAKARYEKFGTPTGNGAEQALPAQPKKERLLQILAEEIQVAEDQAKLTREQLKTGTATFETSIRAELDVLGLKREVAHLEGNLEQARDLIRQQIHTLEDLQRAVRERRQSGVASEADELKLRREILSLKRQQAELQ